MDELINNRRGGNVIKRGAVGRHNFSGIDGRISKKKKNIFGDEEGEYNNIFPKLKIIRKNEMNDKNIKNRLMIKIEKMMREMLEMKSEIEIYRIFDEIYKKNEISVDDLITKFNFDETKISIQKIPKPFDVLKLFTSKYIIHQKQQQQEQLIINSSIKISNEEEEGCCNDALNDEMMMNEFEGMKRRWKRAVVPNICNNKSKRESNGDTNDVLEEKKRKTILMHLQNIRNSIQQKINDVEEKNYKDDTHQKIDEHDKEEEVQLCDEPTSNQINIKLSKYVVDVVKNLITKAAIKENIEDERHLFNTAFTGVPIKRLDLQNYVKVMQVGQGAYGDVWMAEDVVNKRYVALKKLKINEEREGFPKTSTREIILLNSLRHVNIVALHGVVFSKPRSTNMYNKGNVWMVFEYLPFDVSGYLQALKNQKDKKERFTRPSRWLTIGEIKFIMQQVLCALHYCHKNNVIHRDIKSANLLMDLDGTIKLADFGLARLYDVNIPQLTNRVITLWYRPPELLLGSESYGTPVDLWSVGCILAEMICATPLFAANKESQMLRVIAERIGPPTERDCRALKLFPMWNQVDSNPVHPDNVDRLNDESMLIEDAVKRRNEAGEKGWDLLKRLLSWSPKDRITANEALNHEWFKTAPLPEKLKDRSDVRAAHSYQTKNQKYKRSRDVPVKRNDIKHVNAGAIRVNLRLQYGEQNKLNSHGVDASTSEQTKEVIPVNEEVTQEVTSVKAAPPIKEEEAPTVEAPVSGTRADNFSVVEKPNESINEDVMNVSTDVAPKEETSDMLVVKEVPQETNITTVDATDHNSKSSPHSMKSNISLKPSKSPSPSRAVVLNESKLQDVNTSKKQRVSYSSSPVSVACSRSSRSSKSCEALTPEGVNRRTSNHNGVKYTNHRSGGRGGSPMCKTRNTFGKYRKRKSNDEDEEGGDMHRSRYVSSVEKSNIVKKPLHYYRRAKQNMEMKEEQWKYSRSTAMYRKNEKATRGSYRMSPYRMRDEYTVKMTGSHRRHKHHGSKESSRGSVSACTEDDAHSCYSRKSTDRQPSKQYEAYYSRDRYTPQLPQRNELRRSRYHPSPSERRYERHIRRYNRSPSVRRHSRSPSVVRHSRSLSGGRYSRSPGDRMYRRRRNDRYR